MEQFTKQRIIDIQQGNVPAGYRKTKLGIVPTDWNEVPLDSILQKVVRKVPKPQAAYWRLGVRSHAKGTFRELVEDPATVNMDELYSVRANDLVVNITFAWEHAIAIVNEHDSGLLVSHRFPTYTFRNNASPDFYRYVITQKWMKEQLDLISPGGAGRNRVMNKNLFLKISSYLPPLEEQRRIAEILGCCDRMIALKKELIAEKKKQKKALMQKLLNPDSGFRLPGFSGEWKSVMLSECVALGKVKISPADCDKSCKCIELEHIAVENGKLLGHCSPERVQSLKTVFHKNDILFGKLRPYLKKIILAPFDGICCSECWVLKVAYNINPAFLYNRLFMDDFISASCTVSGTKMPRADWQYVKDFQLFIPEITEQQAIADILSAADKEIDLLEQELAQQEQKKKSLMQLLLTGIVRV